MAVSYIGYTGNVNSENTWNHTLTAGANRWVTVMLAYFASGIPALPSSVTFGGSTMTLEVSVTSSSSQVTAIIGIYSFEVPVDWTGVKVVDVDNGSPVHQDHHIGVCVECHGVSEIGQTASDNNNEDLTISGCLDSSFLLNMITSDGTGTPSFVSGGTLIAAAGHNDGDDRYDRGWGFARGTPSGGSNTFDWTAADRAIAAIELLQSGDPKKMRYYRRERVPDYISALDNQ